MRRVLIVAIVTMLMTPVAAHAKLSPYLDESSLIATTPGTDDGSITATLNPAQWALMERPETAIWWSDRQVLSRKDDYGFAAGRGLGFSYRHRILPSASGPRGVGDYQIGLGFKDPFGAVGMAYGFSGPGRSAFDRTNFLSIGRIARPTPWLSFGSTGRTDFSGESQGVVDLGLRPLSDPRITLFADYALENHRHWDDGDASFGASVRPIPGLEAAGRWSEHDRFQLTLGVTVAKNGFRSHSRYDHSDLGATNFVVRMNPPLRGLDPAARLLKGRRFLEMDLKGEAVYRPHRFFDEDALAFYKIVEDLSFAVKDPTVGGVAINLSGFDANIEMVWELREKLLDLRHAGKKSVVYIDRPGATDYYLASAADKIVMDPFGMLGIPGVQTSKTYMKDALTKLGIGFEEWRYFKYKSAMETLSRRDMSDADREQRGDLVRATYDELAQGITESGRMTREQFDTTINEEPVLMPRRLLELKWIDAVAAPDTLRDLAKQVTGKRLLFQKTKAARAARWMPDESWGPKPTVALVYAIGECAMDAGIKGRATSKALKKFRERRDVKAVVLRADSPGGDPLASDLVAREMLAYRKAGKPLLVSMGRVAGSGGYWISMNAARINATPFTVTGSIGVIGGWAWDEGLGKKLGLTYDKVQLGKSADLLGGLRIPFLGIQIPERNLDEREHVVMKKTMLELYDDFTQHVALGRGLPVDRVREIAQGHVYMGRRALEIKLVDEIATLDRTVEEAKSAARIATGRRVRIEEYPRPPLFRVPSLFESPVRMFLREGSAPEASDREPWTYEQRGLAWMLKNPGTPLLLTPASLLPDEAAPR